MDAVRGCAMLMVFLSHTKQHFEITSPDLYWVLLTVTRIATPAFLLLSGFVIRHVLVTDKKGTAGITLIDRALFLLIVGHALIGFANLPDVTVAQWLFDRTRITDAIGFALLFAVMLRGRSAATLFMGGCTIFILSWIVASTFTFDDAWSQWLAAVTVQWRGSTNPEMDVPIVGYFGVFLIGMALHAHLERPLMMAEYPQIARRLFLYGALAVGAALLGVIVWHLGKDIAAALLGNEEAAARAREFLDPRGKRPPSPAYLAFYGGLSLILLATFFRGKPAGLVQPVVRGTSVIGRASLMCFIVQDWVFFVVPRVFGFSEVQSTGFWLLYLAAATLGLFALAHIWGRAHGNRYLTVGLKALAERRRASAHARAVSKRMHDPKTHLF